MTRPRAFKTQEALDDIERGMTQYAAAKKHGVNQSVLSRIRRRENEKRRIENH